MQVKGRGRNYLKYLCVKLSNVFFNSYYFHCSLYNLNLFELSAMLFKKHIQDYFAFKMLLNLVIKLAIVFNVEFGPLIRFVDRFSHVQFVM